MTQIPQKKEERKIGSARSKFEFSVLQNIKILFFFLPVPKIEVFVGFGESRMMILNHNLSKIGR
jgi:hypothetical protein